MKIKTFFILSLICMSLISCGKSSNCAENENQDCICTMEYDPVCGCNDKTYSNACAANCAGIDISSQGECP